MQQIYAQTTDYQRICDSSHRQDLKAKIYCTNRTSVQVTYEFDWDVMDYGNPQSQKRNVPPT